MNFDRTYIIQIVLQGEILQIFNKLLLECAWTFNKAFRIKYQLMYDS